jgi:predicted ATPase
MATVYLAHDVRHNRPVAIKVMDPEVSKSIGPDRFLREIAIIARLSHPHIVPLFDSGAAGDHLYYVMPYVEGASLRAHLNQVGQLPTDEAVELARQIASALGHAHARGLVHRDIKPENILLADGMALVADFGIARSTGAGLDDVTQVATIPGGVFGTPLYMSPEQAAGREVDARADIYSLACILFEMQAGQPPFTASTADVLLRLHLTAQPRPVTDLRPTTPPGLARLISRGLAKLPADRFATAAQFAEALASATSEVTPPSGTAPVGVLEIPNNLPRPRTQFIGRERELAECARLLREVRLLTLTGIGGGGKTRLAIRAAEESIDHFPDGLWLVDLSPVSDGDRVLDTIAATLGVRQAAGEDVRAALAAWVRGRRLLLILDNCEHLLAGTAAAADDLLEAGAEPRVMATSREALGIQGERLLNVGPLGAPAAGVRDLTAVASSDAVGLFVDRARQVVRDFALDEHNADAVADICRRLDGIPLALELAAARVKVLSVDQIRGRLDDRFRLLTGGSKSALPRHQTLQATIAWSYDTLTREEQHLLRLLSVFAGGWTLDTATAVYGDGADEFEVLDLLTRLIDKSLVVVSRDAKRDARYSLLETVRQYAAERLIDAEDAAAVRRRHAEAFLAMAERAYEGAMTEEAVWSAAIEQEHDNLRTALGVLRESDAERYLQLAGALAWFWQGRSYLREGTAHVIAALDATPPAPARKTRARALWGAAQLRAWQGDATTSHRMMEESLRMWRELGDHKEIALALEGLGWVQFRSGDDEKACTAFEESLALQRESGDTHLVNRATVGLAQMLVALGRVDEARRASSEILQFAQAHDDLRSAHYAWHYLADCALLEDNCAEAYRLYRQSLELARQIGDRLEIGFEVQGVAMSLAGLGHAQRALGLGGAVEAELRRLGADVRIRFWDDLLNRYFEKARRALGPAASAEAWNHGEATAFDAAVVQALDPRLTRAPANPMS